jgi:F-type H+-transporting ATPase subunit a
MNSPLDSTALFQLGPIAITQAIVTTWAIMVMLVVGAFFLTRRLDLRPTRRQAALELMVATLDTQISETTGAAPAPYRGFIGTLFVFILVANWSSLVPGIEPPTARLETDAGLAILVFLSVIWFGIRQGGVGGWLKSFAAPNPVMIPLNILQSLTRVFSMFVRLFGNVMSGVFVIGIVASLAGLLVPIPLMALDLLTASCRPTSSRFWRWCSSPPQSRQARPSPRKTPRNISRAKRIPDGIRPYSQYFLRRIRRGLRGDRPRPCRGARRRRRDGRHRPTARCREHDLAHAVRRACDDRDDGDLLSGDRAPAALRQPASGMSA